MVQQTLTHASCYKNLTPDSNFPEEPQIRVFAFDLILLGLNFSYQFHQLTTWMQCSVNRLSHKLGQRQSFLSTGDNYSFPVAWVNSFIFVVV